MFRRRPRPLTGPTTRVQVVEDAAVPVTDAGGSVTLTCWGEVVDKLAAEGWEILMCPGMCRRKGDHAHLRCDAAGTDVTVSPAAVERSGA